MYDWAIMRPTGAKPSVLPTHAHLVGGSNSSGENLRGVFHAFRLPSPGIKRESSGG